MPFKPIQIHKEQVTHTYNEVDLRDMLSKHLANASNLPLLDTTQVQVFLRQRDRCQGYSYEAEVILTNDITNEFNGELPNEQKQPRIQTSRTKD